MQPHDSFQQDFVNQTVLHPVGLAAILVLGLLMLVLPRRFALIPMLVMACFVAPAQRVAIFSLNFDLLRIMVLFGSLRLLITSEWRQFRLSSLDTAVILCTLFGGIIYAIQTGGEEAKFALGEIYDGIGMYFLFRCLIRSAQDIEHLVTAAMVISVPVAAAFAVEHSTGKNLFAFLGGVPEVTEIREGRLRCQGAFAHPILAGCFWAALTPFMLLRLIRGGLTGRALALTGLVASTWIIIACASSTPIVAMALGLAAMGLFYVGRYVWMLRWSLLLMLVGLNFVMSKGVWHLLARGNVLSGSTGFHRYYLIDQTIKHFGDWWALGSRDTAYWGRGLHDVTNFYVLHAVRGGLLTLVLFVAMIALAYRRVGYVCKAAPDDKDYSWMAWAVGCSLLVHCLDFLSVSYFGQIMMLWFMCLAMSGSLMPRRARARVRRVRRVVVESDDGDESDEFEESEDADLPRRPKRAKAPEGQVVLKL